MNNFLVDNFHGTRFGGALTVSRHGERMEEERSQKGLIRRPNVERWRNDEGSSLHQHFRRSSDKMRIRSDELEDVRSHPDGVPTFSSTT